VKLVARIPEFDDTIIVQTNLRLQSAPATFVVKNKSFKELNFKAYFPYDDQFVVTPSLGILKPESSRQSADNVFKVGLKPSRHGKYSNSILFIEVTLYFLILD
jgi:hypothetical protein